MANDTAELYMRLVASKTGYVATQEAKINADQWGAICHITEGRRTPRETQMQETLKAIVARVQGVFDDPALLAKGVLHTSIEEDVLRFAVEELEKP